MAGILSISLTVQQQQSNATLWSRTLPIPAYFPIQFGNNLIREAPHKPQPNEIDEEKCLRSVRVRKTIREKCTLNDVEREQFSR